MSDTDPAALERYLALVRAIPKPERFLRALALSALARAFAWEGARRSAGLCGEAAVVERFLLQLYGPSTGPRMVAMLRRDASAQQGPHE